jgi:hypothetical protein
MNFRKASSHALAQTFASFGEHTKRVRPRVARANAPALAHAWGVGQKSPSLLLIPAAD